MLFPLCPAPPSTLKWFSRGPPHSNLHTPPHITHTYPLPPSTTLEWLKLRLTEEGFGYRTISGTMPLKQRTKAIEAFQKDPPTTVFLLSMRSGAGTGSGGKAWLEKDPPTTERRIPIIRGKLRL